MRRQTATAYRSCLGIADGDAGMEGEAERVGVAVADSGGDTDTDGRLLPHGRHAATPPATTRLGRTRPAPTPRSGPALYELGEPWKPRNGRNDPS
jgi:hypothetical protein